MARVKIGHIVQKVSDNTVADATVTVRLRGTTTNVQLYNGSGGTIGNPVTTVGGKIEAWVDEGRYDLVISGAGFTTYTQEFEAVVPTLTGDISSAKLADDAVTNPKIANDSVGTTEIINGAVTSAKIADSTIATGDIADGAITYPKIGDAQVTTAKLTQVPGFRSYFTQANTASVASGNDAQGIGHAVIMPNTYWNNSNMYNTTTGQVTFPIAGFYLIGYQLDLAGGTGSITSWLASNTYTAALLDYARVSPWLGSAPAPATFSTIIPSTLFSTGFHLRAFTDGSARPLEKDFTGPTDTNGTSMWAQWLAPL